MLTGRQMICIQLELECIGFDREGRLVRIPGPNPDDIARVYAYRDERGYALYFRSDLPGPVVRRIQALGAETAFHQQDVVRDLLAGDAPCAELNCWRSYVFPEPLGEFPQVVRLEERHRRLIEQYHAGMEVAEQAVLAVICDDRIVSTCLSVRENEMAGECYTYTLPDYRRRGYGRQVTAAWGSDLCQQGKVAFYSHLLDNAASRGVARSLGLRACFAGVAYI
jgi:GNAT superfamily N-acetyltransferase